MHLLVVRLLVAVVVGMFGSHPAAASVVATPDCSNGQHWYGNAEVYGYWSSAEEFYADLYASYGGDEASFLAYWQGTKVALPAGTRLVVTPYGSFPYSPVDVCTVGDGPVASGGGSINLVLPEVTQDDYTAALGIFGAAVAALCAVAGLAWVARFFNRSPDA